MIKFGENVITSVVPNSIFGHGGYGDSFPLNLFPPYRDLRNLARELGVTIIAKSTTRYPRVGNYNPLMPWKCVRQIKNDDGTVVGMLNSYGLTNYGVEVCALRNRRAKEMGFNVIPSYFPEFKRGDKILGMKDVFREVFEAIRIYYDALGLSFWALEYNASCPNSGESLKDNEKKVVDVAQYVRSIFRGCLIVKLSPVHSVELALELEKIGVDVIHALNTFPHGMLFPDKISPLAHLGGGGYSGEMVFGRAFEINSALREKLKIPMIFGCGISNHWHVIQYLRMLGKVPGQTAENNSFAICSVIRIDPSEAEKLIRSGLNIDKF